MTSERSSSYVELLEKILEALGILKLHEMRRILQAAPETPPTRTACSGCGDCWNLRITCQA